MKLDVAVQSFKKPELLLYTLLSLKKYSQDSIDTIWIQDDSNDAEIIKFYDSDSFRKALFPWNIKIRKNSQRGGWWFTPVKGLYPKYLAFYKRVLFSIRARYYGTGFELKRENSRYQWAIDNTEKKYLMIIHDDIVFYQDVIVGVLNKFNSDESLAIVGDLGQCWRCNYHHSGCNPQKIIQGHRPSIFWPGIPPNMHGHRWPCRINEWCCILKVDVAKHIENKYHVLYGNMDNSGDVSAYWFNLINLENYNFDDISSSNEEKSRLFLHADGGSGHSVWVDQGNGKKVYDGKYILDKIKIDFDIDIDIIH